MKNFYRSDIFVDLLRGPPLNFEGGGVEERIENSSALPSFIWVIARKRGIKVLIFTKFMFGVVVVVVVMLLFPLGWRQQRFTAIHIDIIVSKERGAVGGVTRQVFRRSNK